MSRTGAFTWEHRDEAILGECPHCRLPIYENDPHRNLPLPPGNPPRLFHAGCAMSAEGLFWEETVKSACQRLRGCGYVVELKIIRPMR